MLVDTQTVFWSSFEPSKVSLKAAEALFESRDRGLGLFIASSTLWEIAMMISRGRVRISHHSLNTYLGLVEERFQVLPITGLIAERAVVFTNSYPKDPTDRLIGATALVHGLTLVTADAAIRKSGEVPCIW